MAQNEMGRVGTFVRFRANKAWLYAGTKPVEIFRAPCHAIHSQLIFEYRRKKSHEVPARSHLILPKERLRFVHPHALGFADRLVFSAFSEGAACKRKCVVMGVVDV